MMDRGIHSVQSAAYALIVLTGISYILALVKNKLLAYNLGAEQSLDLYFAAFRIPDIIFIVSIIFVSSYALIPFFEKKDEGALKKFINSIFTFYIITIFILALSGFFLMPIFAKLFFSGFNAEELNTLVNLSQILLLQVIFLSISAFYSSIIQFKRKFLIFGLLPIFYNLGIVIGIVFFLPKFGLRRFSFWSHIGICSTFCNSNSICN